jgi:hypothetical protein
MASPKNGKAGTAVSPTDPTDAHEADAADPGEIEKIKAEQRQTRSGKYGAVKLKPFKPSESVGKNEKKITSWVEIELVDENHKPVAGEKYVITLPDGTFTDGTLDEKGFARIEGCEPGTCKVTFPRLDKDAWSMA